MEALTYLTYISVVVLMGIGCSVISRKYKIPNILLLIFVGIFLNKFWNILNFIGEILEFGKFISVYTPYVSEPLISFPPLFIATLALLTLVMIVFESTSNFKYKDFDDFSLSALKLTVIYFFVNLFLLSIVTNSIFALENILIAMLFSSLMSGTSADAVMSMIKDSGHEVVKLLEIESIINTPLIVIAPFIILEFMNSVTSLSSVLIISKFTEQIVPFLQQIITGIGAGVLIGIVALKILREQYNHVLSPLALISGALITYVLAENLGGNGILAITAMGLLFGNMVVKGKGEIKQFSSLLSAFLEMMVFVLLGLLIDIPWNGAFISKSGLLFCIFLVLRFITLEISFRDKDFSLKEKVFMTLVVPKGVATAVVAVSLLGMEIASLTTVLDVTLAFMLYSIILSAIVLKYSKYFLNIDVLKEKRVCHNNTK